MLLCKFAFSSWLGRDTNRWKSKKRKKNSRSNKNINAFCNQLFVRLAWCRPTTDRSKVSSCVKTQLEPVYLQQKVDFSSEWWSKRKKKNAALKFILVNSFFPARQPTLICVCFWEGPIAAAEFNIKLNQHLVLFWPDCWMSYCRIKNMESECARGKACGSLSAAHTAGLHEAVHDGRCF